MPVSHNIRIGKFAEKGRLDDQNIEQIKKTFLSGQLCEFIFLASCPDIYENLWNQLGAHVVNCNDSGGQNIMLFRPITNTKSNQRNKHSRKGLDSIISGLHCDQCRQKKTIERMHPNL